MDSVNTSAGTATRLMYKPFGFFRFLLATMVVVSHTNELGGNVIRTFFAPYGIGNMAVMTFFILSGYIIAEANELFYKGRAHVFLLNRLLRIVPPYLVSLLFSVVLHFLVTQVSALSYYDEISIKAQNEMFSFVNISGNLLILFGNAMYRLGLSADYIFVRYIWAIVVEMKFYIIMACVYFFMSKAQLNGKKQSLAIAAIFLFFSFCFVYVMYKNRTHLSHFEWIPYFILGIQIYYLPSFISNSAVGKRWSFYAASLTTLLFVNWHAFVYITKKEDSPIFACLLILNILIVLIFVLCLRSLDGVYKRVDKMLGNLSYPIYLNHYAISILFISFTPLHMRQPLVFFFCLFISIFASWLLNMVSEPLTENIRNKLRGQVL